MKTLFSVFTLKLPIYLVYMLQQVEYEPSKFIDWLKRLFRQNKKLSSVQLRQKLIPTNKAMLLVTSSYIFGITILSVYIYVFSSVISWLVSLIAVSLVLPILVCIYLWSVTWLAHRIIVKPNQEKLLKQATDIFGSHKGIKIAVLGSYGKTTMKELLKTVLSGSKIVAETPGNMNVSVSHAKFAKSLTGDEEVLIVEFGEGAPGDIKRMASMLKPDIAVITGLAPNHLDFYPSVDAVAEDLLEIYNFVEKDKVYVNGESKLLEKYLSNDAKKYSVEGIEDWKTSNIKISPNKTEFVLKNKSKKLELSSGLLGRHQVAPLSFAAYLALDIGANNAQVTKAISESKPFSHRMQPRFVHGAWLIDDTYNGNLEGLQAGLKFLSELKAKRSWYVTPGLVDQGAETERVHNELGKSIAEANPTIVVLMQNSVTQIIKDSIAKAGYKGELRIESNPLEFYTNIEHIVASGDIILIQNDWTDNYN